MAVTLRVKNIDAFTKQFDMGLGVRPTVRVNLTLTGPAAAYSAVWEWGRVDVNPGPKTLWSTNPDGDRVVLTRTAPFGWIRVNRQQYRNFIREELAKIQWHRVKPKQIPGLVQWALQKAASRCADLMAATAPYDTGQLRAAILALSIITGDEQQVTFDTLSLRTRVRRQIA
jgi:hypothetical protein